MCRYSLQVRRRPPWSHRPRDWRGAQSPSHSGSLLSPGGVCPLSTCTQLLPFSSSGDFSPPVQTRSQLSKPRVTVVISGDRVAVPLFLSCVPDVLRQHSRLAGRVNISGDTQRHLSDRARQRRSHTSMTALSVLMLDRVSPSSEVIAARLTERSDVCGSDVQFRVEAQSSPKPGSVPVTQRRCCGQGRKARSTVVQPWPPPGDSGSQAFIRGSSL